MHMQIPKNENKLLNRNFSNNYLGYSSNINNKIHKNEYSGNTFIENKISVDNDFKNRSQLIL